MQKFKGEHILLDTNLLITLVKDIGFGFFDDFLNELKNLNIKSVVEEATLFEFKRGSRKQSDVINKDNFLRLLLGKDPMVLSPSKEIMNNAEDLAILYSHKNPTLSKQISFIDCLVAAQLMKYKNNKLCLATIDNNDYPLFIFNRDKLITIDTGKEIINIGIYTFNEEKYRKCKHDFKKS
jgi:hypothetical protein